MVNINTNANALTFQTIGLATVDLKCNRLIRAEATKGGKTSAKVHAKFVQREEVANSLFAQITIDVIGKPNDRPEETSFTLSLTIESQLLFQANAPEPNDLPHETINSIFEPLFYTALERCRLNVWQLGYSGVRLPIKPLNISEIPSNSITPIKSKKKRTPKSKST
jgi:hypothetical protein